MKKIMQKWKDLSPGVKSSFGFLIANILTTGIAYLTTPIFTRLLTSEQFGQTSIYMTWQHVLGIIAMFCLSYGVFNNGMLEYENKRDEFIFSLLCLSNIITIGFGLVIIMLYPHIGSIINLPMPLIILMFCTFLFQPAYNFWIARQRYEYKYLLPLIAASVIAIVSPIIAIICIGDFSNKVYARLFGTECAAMFVYIIIYIVLGKKANWRLDRKYWKYALLFNLPLIPHYLSSYLLNSSDKIMISYLIGDSATAYYSVAYSVGAVATIIWSAVNGSLIPYTYQKCKEKKYEDINNVVVPILFVFAIGCILVIMLAPEIVRIMATSEYMEAIYVIPPIVGGFFFQIQYFIYSNVIFYYKKPYYVTIGSMTSVILNIVLNYVFIPKFGYIAAGYTTLICFAIQAGIDYCAMKYIVRNNIYRMKTIVSLSVGVVFISIFSRYIYTYTVLRWCIVVAILVVGFIFRNQMIKLLKKVRSE